TGVSITKTFSTSLIVGWTDQSASESGSRIERSSDGAAWTAVGTVGPNVTSFQDNGLTPDTAYFYRVVAFDFLSESASDSINPTTSSQLLQVAFDSTGLHNITYNGTALTDLSTFPQDGFRVGDYKIRRSDGSIVRRAVDALYPHTFNAETKTLS